MRLPRLQKWARMTLRRHPARPAGGRVRLLLECLEDRTLPSTVNWINPAGGDWDTASNWQDADTGAHRLPTAADDAVISQSGITVTHSSPFNTDTVHSLTSAADLAVSGGNLVFDTPSTTQALTLTGAGGTVTVASTDPSNPGSLEVGTLTQGGGTLTGPGTLTVDSSLMWTAGTMGGTGSTEIEGTAQVGNGTAFGPTLGGRTLDNFGTTTVVNGSTIVFNGGTLNNQSGGQLVLQGNVGLGNIFSTGGSVSNAGILVKTGAGTSTVTVGVPFDNTGTVDVQHGTLNITGAFTNEGTLTLEPGTITNLSGGGNSSGAIDQGADSRLGLGSFTLLSGATAALASGSELDVNGPVTQQGGTDVTLGAGSLLSVATGFSNYTLADGAAVDGAGTVRVGSTFGGVGTMTANGSVSVGNLSVTTGTVIVNGSANLDVQNFTQSGGFLAGRGTLTVENALQWTGGTMNGGGQTVVNGTAEVAPAFGGPDLGVWEVDNFGSATVDNGANLYFGGGSVWANEPGSTLTLLGSGSLAVSSFGAAGNAVTNAGTLVKAGLDTSTATVVIPLDNIGTVDVQHGTLNVTGGFTNEGTLALEAGAAASLPFGSSSGAISQAAYSTLNLTNFTLLSGATATLATGSELDAFRNVTQQGGTDITLAAGSLLNVEPSGGFNGYTLADGAKVDGSGTVQLINFASQMTVTGAVSVNNLSMVAGTLTVNNPANLDVQNYTQTGGTLTGGGTLTVENSLNWTGGTMSGPGQTVINGTGTVGSSSFFGVTLDTRTVNNNGTVTVPADGRVLFRNSAVWNNLAGSTLVLGSNSSLGVTNFGTSGTLVNGGLIEDTGPTSQVSINLSLGLTNSGTVSVRGVLNVGGSYVQTADGTLTIVLSPGSPVASGQLKVFGPATLDGTLNVDDSSGATPTNGQTFTILTTAPFTGDVTGDFANFTGLNLGGGLTLTPAHNNSSYTLTATAS